MDRLQLAATRLVAIVVVAGIGIVPVSAQTASRSAGDTGLSAPRQALALRRAFSEAVIEQRLDGGVRLNGVTQGITINNPVFTGVASFADGTAAAPSLTFAAHPNYGMWSNGAASQLNFSVAGAQIAAFATDNIYFPATNLWLGPLLDVTLARDAANTLAQRNGTNAQTIRMYGTYTDASNYERLVLDTSAGNFQIYTQSAGTGSARQLKFGVNAGIQWLIDTSGNFTDNGTHTITAGSSIKSTGATGGLGYATGAGGAVTQLTSRATTVILNTVTGDITLFSAAGSATAASFTVTNSNVAVTDNIVINQKSGTNLYNTIVTTMGAGSFVVTFYTTGGTAVDAPVFHFSVIKGVSS